MAEASPPSHPPGPPVIAWILPLLGWGAAWIHSRARLDADAAAETRYLALLIVVVLLALAVPRLLRSSEIGLLTVAGLFGVWTLPAGPLRGAVLCAGLALCLAGAAWRLAGQPEGADLASLTGLGLGVQVLFLSDALLPEVLGLRTLGELVLPPVVAGVALWVLVRGRRPALVLVAGGAAALAAAGLSPQAAAGLLALAGGDLFGRAASLGGWRWLALTALVPAFGLGIETGLVAATGAALLAAPAAWRGIAALPAAALLLLPGLGWGEAVAAFAWLPLLVPALAGAVGTRWDEALVAGLLGFAAVRLGPAPDILVVPAVLIVLALARDREATALQALWTGTLLTTAAAAAAYPWLREEPAATAVGLFGLAPAWMAVGILWLAAALVRALARGVAARWPVRPSATPYAAGLVALAAVVALPALGTPLLRPSPMLLSAERSAWSEAFEPRQVREVRVLSTLAHAAALPAGTLVAEVGLLDEGDEWVRLELRAGLETAEWAARRPGVRQTPGFTAPPAWVAFVADGGRLFGERYRTRWELERPTRASRVEVHRSTELPEEVDLLLFRLELVP